MAYPVHPRDLLSCGIATTWTLQDGISAIFCSSRRRYKFQSYKNAASPENSGVASSKKWGSQTIFLRWWPVKSHNNIYIHVTCTHPYINKKLFNSFKGGMNISGDLDPPVPPWWRQCLKNCSFRIRLLLPALHSSSHSFLSSFIPSSCILLCPPILSSAERRQLLWSCSLLISIYNLMLGR